MDFNNEYLKKIINLALPVMLGTSVGQLNVLIDRTIASGIVVGGISALNYANRLNGFIQDIFANSISTVMYPLITKMAVLEDVKGFKRVIGENINLINVFLVPATVGLFIFSVPITKLVYGRGAFDGRALVLTSGALLFYSLGMTGVGAGTILSRAFYSLQDTRTPMINSVYAVILNIILNITLSKFMGISGIAFATSISNLFCTGLLFLSLKKKIGPYGMKDMVYTFLKVVFTSLVMGVIARLFYIKFYVMLGGVFSLLSSIFVGAAVYFIIILFMRIKEIDFILSKVRGYFR